jgi:hypothetical protein
MLKSLPSLLAPFSKGKGRHNLRILRQLLAVFALLVLLFSVCFQFIMRWEGQEHSWTAGVYWTLVVMSTLGFGDITFTSDLGRWFSAVWHGVPLDSTALHVHSVLLYSLDRG